MKILKPEIKGNEIDVSKSLLSPGRLLYPKVAKKGKLDELLARRYHWKALEERALNAKKVSVVSFMFDCCLKDFSLTIIIPFRFLQAISQQATAKLQQTMAVNTTPAVTSVAAVPISVPTTGTVTVPSNVTTSTPGTVTKIPVTPKPVVQSTVSSTTNNRALFQALSTRIHELQAHYMALSKLNKWYTCYSGRCVPTKVSDCYSPLCRKRCRLRTELLELLHKANALNQANKENKVTSRTPQQQLQSKVVKTEGTYGRYLIRRCRKITYIYGVCQYVSRVMPDVW